jgi:hypothetical protein
MSIRLAAGHVIPVLICLRHSRTHTRTHLHKYSELDRILPVTPRMADRGHFSTEEVTFQ